MTEHKRLRAVDRRVVEDAKKSSGGHFAISWTHAGTPMGHCALNLRAVQMDKYASFVRWDKLGF